MKLLYPIIFFSLFLFSYCSQSNIDRNQKVEFIPKKEIKIDLIKKGDSIERFKTPYSLAELLGKFNPKSHPDFVKIAPKHSDKSMYLRKDAYNAFIEMYNAAKKDGITLLIRSATRNFERQKQIWESKWTGARLVDGKNLAKTIKSPKERALKILEFSSMPSTSRHHWGTDIDLIAFDNSYFEKGQGKKEYDWLLANASSFGFCQPYTKKDKKRPNGYQEEKWHWSFMSISKILTKQAKLELSNDKIVGFQGAETASEIDVVKNYVLSINQYCKN